jgi:hypothetical protein
MHDTDWKGVSRTAALLNLVQDTCPSSRMLQASEKGFLLGRFGRAEQEAGSLSHGRLHTVDADRHSIRGYRALVVHGIDEDRRAWF